MNEALHFEVEPIQRFAGKSQPVKRPKVPPFAPPGNYPLMRLGNHLLLVRQKPKILPGCLVLEVLLYALPTR
jgi:hypothetical protein